MKRNRLDHYWRRREATSHGLNPGGSGGYAAAGILLGTAPLAGLWSHQKGGFFHDGRFATLRDVIDHYSSCRSLGLAESEKSDLIEYLKSL